MKSTFSAAKLPLVFYYHRHNRYSFNALAGTLDSHPGLEGWPIVLARTPEEVRSSAAAALRQSDRIAVGFSILTMQFEEVRRLMAELRAGHPAGLTIIAGGPHASAHVRDTLEAGADIVFRGEAEVSFPQVLQRLAGGQDIAGITGIACRTKEGIAMGPRAEPVDLEAYASFAPKRGMFGPIEITRGCPFTCSYCQTSHLFGIKPRHRSIPQIVAQAASLRSRGRRTVRLLSPNAFSYGSPDGRQLNLPALSELLRALRDLLDPGDRIICGYFPSEVRPEHVTPETIGLVRRYADNDEIVIGAQSGSERMLEACHRSHSVRDVLTAVALARKSGLKVIVDFIFGLPGETEQDVRDTTSVLRELSRMGARIHAHPFAPLPQTAFAAYPPGDISPVILGELDRLKKKRAMYGDYRTP